MRIAYAIAILVIAYGSIILGATTRAQQLPDRDLNALSNLQHEFTTCFAYYSLNKQCIENRKNSEDRDLIQQTSKVLDRLLQYSFETGRTIGMTQDAMISRQKLEINSMMSLIKNSCVNISSLLARYATRCKTVTENPDSILTEYLSKK